MAGHTTQISPFVGRPGLPFPATGQLSTPLVPTELVQGIQQIREQLQLEGGLPPDITEEEMAQPTGAGLKFNTTLAKFFPDLAREKLSRPDIFPGFAGARVVGEVTGQFIGRQPLIVATGGLFPVEIVEARKRALQAGAAKNLALQAAFLDEFPDTDASYKAQVFSIGFDILAEAEPKVNSNFSALFDLSNPVGLQFQKDMKRLDALAAQLIKAPEMARAIIADNANKELSVPRKVFDAAVAINAGFINVRELFDDPEMFKQIIAPLVSFNNTMHVLRTEAMPMLEKSVDQFIEEIKQDRAVLGELLSTPDFETFVVRMKKEIDQGLIRRVAKDFIDGSGLVDAEGKEETVENISSLLTQLIGSRVKENFKSLRKFNLGARSMRKKQPTVILPETGTVNIRNFVRDKKTGEVISTEIVSLDVVKIFNIPTTASQPRDINIVPDLIFDTIDDKRFKTVGSIKADLGQIVDFVVNPKTGRIVVPQPKDLSKFEIKRFALIIVKDEIITKEGNRIEEGKSVFVPFEKVEQNYKNANIRIVNEQLIFEPVEQGEQSLSIQIFEPSIQ